MNPEYAEGLSKEQLTDRLYKRRLITTHLLPLTLWMEPQVSYYFIVRYKNPLNSMSFYYIQYYTKVLSCSLFVLNQTLLFQFYSKDIKVPSLFWPKQLLLCIEVLIKKFYWD